MHYALCSIQYTRFSFTSIVILSCHTHFSKALTEWIRWYLKRFHHWSLIDVYLVSMFQLFLFDSFTISILALSGTLLCDSICPCLELLLNPFPLLISLSVLVFLPDVQNLHYVQNTCNWNMTRDTWHVQLLKHDWYVLNLQLTICNDIDKSVSSEGAKKDPLTRHRSRSARRHTSGSGQLPVLHSIVGI